MYTGKAYDLGRGTRSDPVEGIPQYPPGPGGYNLTRDFDPDAIKGGFDFGRSAAHGGVDDRLTLNDEATYERMMQAREGVIGTDCDKNIQRHGGQAYKGPGHAPIKSTLRPYPFKPEKKKEKKAAKIEQVGPGPDLYTIKMNSGGPSYQFGSRFDDRRVPPTNTRPDGSRFDSSLRSKPHLKPKKVDGPGPGDYIMPSSI